MLIAVNGEELVFITDACMNISKTVSWPEYSRVYNVQLKRNMSKLSRRICVDDWSSKYRRKNELQAGNVSSQKHL